EYLGYGVIGASGATSGLLGAYVVRFYFSRISVAYWIFMPLQGVNRAGRKYVPGLLAVAFWILYQGVYTVMQFGAGYMHVAYSVHLGGFACGALMAVLFGGSLEAKAERRLIRAREHGTKASYFASQGEYINYLDLKPDDYGAHAEAARAFCCTGERGKAKYHFTESIIGLLESSRRGEAEDVFANAMRCVPGFTLPERPHLSLAFGMERSMKFNGAMKAYSGFLRRYPGSPECPLVLLRMAGLHERRFGRPDEAFGCYSELVERFPGDSWAEFARAELSRLRMSNLVLEGSAGKRS
ncbi:MAG TPA: rhomboid family intramembrane serine protease, partial [Candidatus Krumholzibacterium sp.]|nr:rhomboid family intramembrane serine protease [Candidatus Krumholzibacterium sp.]